MPLAQREEETEEMGFKPVSRVWTISFSPLESTIFVAEKLSEWTQLSQTLETGLNLRSFVFFSGTGCSSLSVPF